MSGRPILECICFALLWGVLMIPLRAITRPQENVSETHETQQKPAKEVSTIWVNVRFTEPPAHFSLQSNGDTIWEETDPDHQQEELIDIQWEDHTQGNIALHATWNTQANRATEVRLSFLNGPQKVATIWHDGADLQEALLFQ
jgi:hypothetical protein